MTIEPVTFNYLEIFGWISAFCFGISALPQALRCYRQGHAIGVSHRMIWLWIVGEICAIIYQTPIWREVLPLYLNYYLNLSFIFVIAYYMYFPREPAAVIQLKDIKEVEIE